jgi:hypothetical protein
LIEDNLINEFWLFTYEATYKGWLTSPSNILNTNEYFKILKNEDVFFYDESATVSTFIVKSANEIDEENKEIQIDYETAKQIFTGGGGY